MRALLKKISFILACTVLLCGMVPAQKKALAAGELKLAYQQGEAVTQLHLAVGEAVDLRFLGAPDNWAAMNPHWASSNASVAEVNSSGVVTAKSAGTVAILLFLDNGMSGLAFVSVAENTVNEPVTSPSATPEEEPEPTTALEEELPETSDIKPKEEEKFKSVKVLLLNQDAIHIPEGACFADGTPVQNMYDVVRYAFSFMLEDGTPIGVPNYGRDTTGIADIAGIDFRPIKGASSVIVKTVYLKVYFDLDQDGWVSADEKAEDAIGYYLVEIDVDKTLSVEDWSIVR